jgi:phosphate starvation-inducible PhoH-like protein
MADPLVTRTLAVEDRDEAVILFGPRDQHLRALRDALGVRAVYRGGELKVEAPAEAADLFVRAFEQLRQVARKNGQIGPKDVTGVVAVVRDGTARGGGSVVAAEGGRNLRTRTDGQGRYVQALQTHDVVFCVGPAGSGKTYLAVAWAVALL